MNKRVIVLLWVAIFTLTFSGCASKAASTQTGLPANAAEATMAPTATLIVPTLTSTTEPASVFSLTDFPINITVQIPSSISSNAEGTIVPFGAIPTQLAAPRHVRIRLNNYPCPAIDDQGPAIYVFTTAGLETPYASTVKNTKTVINGSTPDFGIYPALPMISGTTQIQIRVKTLAFQNGKGFRYLEYENIPTIDELSNPQMNYIYQGITQDGKYYISVILPVNIPFLTESISQAATLAVSNATPLPPEILFFPILQKLQTESDTEFFPSLAVLDAMVMSLEVKE